MKKIILDTNTYTRLLVGDDNVFNIETGSVIVSYDLHFLKVPGLRMWDQLY